MSQVPRPRRSGGDSPMSAPRQLLLALAALVALLGFGPAAAQAAVAPVVTQADLCEAWTASTTNPEITLDNGIVVSAKRMTRVGTSCTAAGAQIQLTSASVDDEPS